MRGKEREQEPPAEREALPIEKNDTLAMLLSGFIVIGIPCLILIGIITAVTLLLFG